MKKDKYPIYDQSVAFNEVYDSKKAMLSYMVGLALSQYLWRTHYAMYQHLKKELSINKNEIRNYLEIGPGHGLFFKDAIGIIGEKSNYTAIDISQTSLNLTRSIINFFNLNNKNNIKFINDDMLNVEIESSFDFIVMGEVLEHVENPKKLLLKLNKLLSKNGKSFVSTCVNCPTIDHVYHYKSVDDIREMINEAGFNIINERVLPVEQLPMNEIVERKITINYSAVIEGVNDE